MIDRRRVALMTPELPAQPYQRDAPELPRAEAQALVDRVRRAAEVEARLALATLRAELAPAHELVVVALRQTPFGKLPANVAEVLDYAPFIYAADTMLYLEALASAAETLGLSLSRHQKGEECRLAAAALGWDAQETEAWFKALNLGPPWTEEHRRAAAVATAALLTLSAVQ